MAILDVLNVGQGDCLILRPNKYECNFKDKAILIDLGNGQYDISQELCDDEKLHVVITHHHRDHIGGLKFLYSKLNNIECIYLPNYLDEVSLIARAIMKLKGFANAIDCLEYSNIIEDIISNHLYLKTLQNKIEVKLVDDEYKFCKNHISVLNPPSSLRERNWIDILSKDDLSSFLYELFEKEFADKFMNYIKSIKEGYPQENEFSKYFLRFDRNRRDEEKNFYLTDKMIVDSRQGANFVIGFIVENYSYLTKFNQKPKRKNLRHIYDKLNDRAHDVCIVCKAEFLGNRYLLTGDASKNVFIRLINEGVDISADYLKIPHHGSRDNIDLDILNAINPDVAIISHKNARFGKSLDSHPNIEVINLLRYKNIRMIVTNDVIKGNSLTLVEKKDNKCNGYVDVKELY